MRVHPGANGSFLLYEDDGKSFRYRSGEWMGMQITWNDARKSLTVRLAPSSRMIGPSRRNLEVKMGDATKTGVFEGRNLEIKF